MIKGLLNTPETTPNQLHQTTQPDVAEAVEVTLEAYRELGYQPDIDEATETMTTDFTELTALGHNGRLFVAAPAEVSFDQLLKTAEGKRPEGLHELYRYQNLWTPGTEVNSYTDEELNAASETAMARLALFNATETGVDPLLHFTDLPYDDYAKENWNQDAETTQLHAAQAEKEIFEQNNENFELKTLDHRDFALMALMDRIRSIKLQDQILSRGYMRIPHLGRREVGGGSIVGYVDSGRGQLLLDGSRGFAYPSDGVGLSVGQKELSS